MIRFDLFGGVGLSSRAIEWMGAGPFSHAATEWSSTQLLDARNDLLDGVPPGVRIRTLVSEMRQTRLLVRFSLPASVEQEARLRQFLHDQLNKPYDRPAILGFALGRNWREDDAWFCSELCAAACEAAGLIRPIYSAYSKITPCAFADLISAAGASWEKVKG